jgi:hypothetical protein
MIERWGYPAYDGDVLYALSAAIFYGADRDQSVSHFLLENDVWSLSLKEKETIASVATFDVPIFTGHRGMPTPDVSYIVIPDYENYVKYLHKRNKELAQEDPDLVSVLHPPVDYSKFVRGHLDLVAKLQQKGGRISSIPNFYHSGEEDILRGIMQKDLDRAWPYPNRFVGLKPEFLNPPKA